VVALSQLRGALKLIDSANGQLRKVIDHAEQDKNVAPKLRKELAESEKEKKRLKNAVEANMQYTQALITNLSFLKSTMPDTESEGQGHGGIVDDILNQALAANMQLSQEINGVDGKKCNQRRKY